MRKSLKILIITAFLCLLINLFVTLFLLWNFKSYVRQAMDSYSLHSIRESVSPKPLLPLK